MDEQPPTAPNIADSDVQLARRNRELRILYSISEGLNSAADVHTALESTMSLVAELLGLRSAWVWLLDAEDGPYLAASRHLPPFLREPARMEGWLCLCLRTFLEGDMEGAANVNVLECSRLANAVSGSDGLRYHASIPLYLGEKRVGVLNVAGQDWRRLDPDDLQLLHTIGNQVAVAVERSRLSEESAHTARVEERNHLAREIHDTLAQGFAAITLQLETADALLPTLPAEAGRRVRAATELARDGMREARRSVQGLRAPHLEGRTLAHALQELTARFASGSGVETCLQLPEAPLRISAEAEAAIYRIVQEALANVERHAQARTVLVTIADGGAGLDVTVRDDGIGFATDSPGARGRFGLVGIRERARLLGGELEVESTSGEGALIHVRLPHVSRSGDSP